MKIQRHCFRAAYTHCATLPVTQHARVIRSPSTPIPFHVVILILRAKGIPAATGSNLTSGGLPGSQAAPKFDETNHTIAISSLMLALRSLDDWPWC
jgi:hypothetical protein